MADAPDAGVADPPLTLGARAGACTGSDPDSIFRNVALVDGLIIQQLSQPDRRRDGENVTVMLCNVGLSVRCRTVASVSTLTPESFRT
jgi:hypothetical protein